MTTCIACHGTLTFFGPSSIYNYFRCSDCGTIQLSPMPDEAEIARAYQNEYVDKVPTEEFADPEWWRRASRPYSASIVQALKDYQVRGLVIDYGAGWGHLVDMMIR